MPKGKSQRVQQTQQRNNDRLTMRTERQSPYLKIYGAKPELFDAFPPEERKEIENMTVDLPEGITEEEFAMAVMGAMSDDERMNDRLTSSSKYGSDYDFNHVYMTDNMVKEGGDDRFNGFEKVMVDARKKAIEAVEDFKNGNKEKIHYYHNKFIDGMTTVIGKQGNEEKDVQRTDLYSLEMAGKLLEKPEFKDRLKEGAVTNLSNFSKIQNITVDNLKRKNEFLENIPEKGTKEREDKLVDIVLSSYILNHNVKKAKDAKDALVSEFRNKAVEWGHKSGGTFTTGNTDPEATVLSEKVAKNTVDGIEMMLASEDGYNKIKELYGDAIKNSPLFTMLKDADDDELCNIFETSSDTLKMTNADFKDFKEVSIPPQYEEEAKQRTESGLKEIEETKKTVLDDLKIRSDEFLRHKKYEDQEVSSGDKEDKIRESLGQIDDLLSVLEDADPSYRKLFAGNQEKFAAVKESLKELNEFVKNMDTTPGSMDFNKYNDLSRKVEEKAADYLGYKKDNHTNSSYERKRISAVDKVHDALEYKRRSIQKWNETRFDEAAQDIRDDYNLDVKGAMKGQEFKENSRQKIQKMVDEYKKDKPKTENGKDIGLFNEDVRKAFYGGEYGKLKSPRGYSITRSSVITVSMMAMAATGEYSIEDLNDPKKFTEEKRKMGEEVIRRMQSDNPEDHKWIAGNIIEGQKKMVDMVNNFCEKNDILADGFENTAQYKDLAMATQEIFDSYQEFFHCLKEGDEYLKETQPDATYKTADEFRNMVQDKIRPILTLTGQYSKMMDSAQKFLNNGYFDGGMVQNAIQTRMMKELLKEKRAQNPEKPVTELLKPEEIEQELLAETIVVGNEGSKVAGLFTIEQDLGYGIKAKDIYVDKLIDGTMFKDMKVDRNTFKATDAPNPSKLKAQYKFDIMKSNKEFHSQKNHIVQDASYKLKEKMVGDGAYDVWSSYCDSESKLGQNIAFNMYTDKKRDYTAAAKQYVKEQMAVNLCAKFPDKFKNASKDDIIKGVEKFPEFKKLEANVDKMSLEEVTDLWGKDVTSDIINKTVEKQMKNIEKNKNKENTVQKNTVKTETKNKNNEMNMNILS